MADQVDPNMYTWPFQLTKTMHRSAHEAILPSNPSNSQRGKIIIVTGAYGGVGAATCIVWAQAGASVVLVGRKPDQLAKAEAETIAASTDPSAKFLSVPTDITKEEDVQNLYAQIQTTFGRSADVLFNNAGSAGQPGLLGQMPWGTFTTFFSSHFLGAALMSKYFISTQAKPTDPAGTIIAITSGLGGMLLPSVAAYSIAKLAAHRLMEYIDVEYPRIRAFTLSPGIPLTGMTAPDFMPFAKDPSEMPGMMALYLVQQRADFLKGSWVGINWDIEEMEEHKKEIVEKKLLKLQWMPAKFGEGGHRFEI